MTRAFPLIVAALAIGSGELRAQRHTADSLAIVRLLSERSDAHLDKAADAQRSFYSSDALWINAFGVRREGADSVLSFLKVLYSRPGYREARVVSQGAPEIVFIRPDVAIANEYHDTEGQRLADGTMVNRRTRTTFVLSREKGKWLIRQQYIADERSPGGKQ